MRIVPSVGKPIYFYCTARIHFILQAYTLFVYLWAACQAFTNIKKIIINQGKYYTLDLWYQDEGKCSKVKTLRSFGSKTQMHSSFWRTYSTCFVATFVVFWSFESEFHEIMKEVGWVGFCLKSRRSLKAYLRLPHSLPTNLQQH